MCGLMGTLIIKPKPGVVARLIPTHGVEVGLQACVLRQEDCHEFKSSQSYSVTSYLKINK